MAVKLAPLSKDLETTRSQLTRILGILDSNPQWYGSVFFERKTVRRHSVDLKKSQIAEDVSTGAVLRIYDGHTLYEQATDDLSDSGLTEAAQALLGRARKSAQSGGRPYV